MILLPNRKRRKRILVGIKVQTTTRQNTRLRATETSDSASTSRLSKIFRCLVPRILAHMTNLVKLPDHGTIMTQLPEVLKCIPCFKKIICASQIPVKYLLKDLKTLQ